MSSKRTAAHRWPWLRSALVLGWRLPRSLSPPRVTTLARGAAVRDRGLHGRERVHGCRISPRCGCTSRAASSGSCSPRSSSVGPGRARSGALDDRARLASLARARSHVPPQPARLCRLSVATGLAFHGVVRRRTSTRGAVGFYLCVFGAFVLALVPQLRRLRRSARGVQDGMTFRPAGPRGVRAGAAGGAVLRSADAGRRLRRHPPGDDRASSSSRSFSAIFQYLVGELLKSKRRSDKLQRIATTDELTGLGNREQFHAMIGTADRRRARD